MVSANGDLDSWTEMTTRHAISVVDQGTVHPASFMRWTACCALFALLSSPLFVLAQNTMGHSDNRIVNADVVPQANVDPNTVILPVVEESSLHFRRFSTEDGLSETMVTQVVQDDQGFIWFASLYG